MKLILIFLIVIFFIRGSCDDICPPETCQYPFNPFGCQAYSTYSLNTGGLAIEKCDICGYINNGYFKCLTCKTGFTTLDPISTPYGMNILKCGCSVLNCESCASNPAGCDQCKKGYYFNNGSPPTCVACPRKCAACTSNNKCTECKAENFI